MAVAVTVAVTVARMVAAVRDVVAMEAAGRVMMELQAAGWAAEAKAADKVAAGRAVEVRD
jgi:hypothetical protein